MRWLLLLFSYLVFCLHLFGGEPQFHPLKNLNEAPRFSDSLAFYLDPTSSLKIDDIRQLPDSLFTPLGVNTPLEPPLSLWCRIQLTNTAPQRYDGYFRLFTFIDSIWMYTFADEQLQDVTFTGNVLPPFEKSLFANQTSIPFSLYPSDTKTYYFQLHLNKLLCDNHCLSTLRVIPRHVLERERLISNTQQAFYAGVMLLFALVSIFMYIIFRESVFVWFALMMVCFAAYFSSLYGLTELLFNRHITTITHPATVLIVSGLILSTSLFISHYIDLQSRFRRLFNIYAVFVAFVLGVPYILLAINTDWGNAARISDRLSMGWIIFTMGVITWSARQKDRPSIILLISIVTVSAGAILYLLRTFGLLAASSLLKHSFQIGTVLFAGILFYGMFDKINSIRMEKERFRELDAIKSRFFANISHEFRTPLTLVMGPIQEVLKSKLQPADQQSLRLAHQNAKRLLELINQILDLSKLEANKMKLAAGEHNFSAILKGISMSFESLAKQKNIRFHFVAEQADIPLFIDQEKVETIFYNLLSNAFKFTPKNGEIAIMLSSRKDQVEVMIRDSGVGISADRLPHIFNRFFQADAKNSSKQEGSGIGLALVQELVHLHRGTIRVESEQGQGTTFTIRFPKGRQHLSPEEIVPNTLPPSVLTVFEDQPLTVVAESSPEDAEAPLVLLIEDNDAVRAYIKQQLIQSFHIIEAENGVEGIERAFEHQPDLIISDVMMPHKDGYEICEILKTDQRTSHIPIILLTAKAASEEKMKGLEVGADDYLLKPFDTQELEVRAKNLISSRLVLHKKLAETNKLEAFQAAVSNSVDKAFLQKIHTELEKHLADESFNVASLAQEVGLSRSQLNRKLKALTNHSPNRFIQSFRLQKARELLLARAGNVSEVAYLTGFSSTAYFVKCFGDKYGHTPGSLL